MDIIHKNGNTNNFLHMKSGKILFSLCLTQVLLFQ